ncbi:MAG: bifunctional homocysteine S-methyltransferase/methylenetetrahydrofolate reductase [Chthoniobacterales bacterium]
MSDFLTALNKGVLCGDGAMGTLLAERGIPSGSCFEELCLERPELILEIHREYLAAGASVITTNSFGANAQKLASFSLESRAAEINRRAAGLAREAVTEAGKQAWVAGSVGPLGVSGSEAEARGIDRETLFREQIASLLDGGCDLILLETFQDPGELSLALRIAKSLGSKPVITLIASPESGRLPGGAWVGDLLETLGNEGADLVGLNCVNGPQAMLRLVEKIAPTRPLAVYPNAGRPFYQEGRISYGTTPEYFADLGRRMVESGAALVGGCCGTSPRHIKALSEALKGLRPGPKKPTAVTTGEQPERPITPREKSILDLVAEGKTVIVTELDPPKTLPLEKFFAAAEALTQAGSDAITLADNSLAILRVSNFAVAAMLKQRGITPLLHLSCRDSNVIGLQSELLGMAAMGMRHVLALTGDPAKGGDHPDATSVYDVNSVGLLEIIRRLNEGYTQAGTDLQARPDLVAGCTFNPNSRNLDAQVQKLERKIKAGARYVMTQPVFETHLVEETARRTAHLGVPVFVGVWPLLNGRQALFLHNEVPGISIPGPIMSRMEGLEGTEGRKEGVAIAKEVTRSVLDHFPGVYFMTPFLAYQTTEELSAFVRGG